MTALDRNPQSLNFLASDNFFFYLKRSPNVNFWLQDVNLPEVSFGVANHYTPFQTINKPGDHLQYGPLNVSFKIDENLVNYLEIWNWMRKLGFPNDWDERAELINASKILGIAEVSDILLMIQDSNRIPKFEITYKDAFPIYLSSPQFSSRNSGVDYVTANVIFSFTGYDIDSI